MYDLKKKEEDEGRKDNRKHTYTHTLTRVDQNPKVSKCISPRPEFENKYIRKNNFGPISGTKNDLCLPA